MTNTLNEQLTKLHDAAISAMLRDLEGTTDKDGNFVPPPAALFNAILTYLKFHEFSGATPEQLSKLADKVAEVRARGEKPLPFPKAV